MIPTGSGIKKRRRQPLVESTQEVIRNLRHKQVLQGLAEYSIEVHGEVLRSYYSDREPIQRNESLAASSAAEVMMKAIKRHEIPSSFCIDPDNQKLLLCPRVELNKRTTVYKCCPFGKQLKDPLFSGITLLHQSLLIFHCLTLQLKIELVVVRSAVALTALSRIQAEAKLYWST